MTHVQAEELSLGEKSFRRKLLERSPLIVPDTFQPTHTLLTPNELNHARSSYEDHPRTHLCELDSTAVDVPGAKDWSHIMDCLCALRQSEHQSSSPSRQSL